MSKVFIGGLCGNVSTPPSFEPITKIILLVDDTNYYEAGNDTGRTMEVTCPYGTQEMANNLLAQLGGYEYKPVSAGDALIDPAAELGDGITVGGVYTVFAEEDIAFDHLMALEVSAPGEREMEQEYDFQTQTQQIGRQLAYTRSLITKTAEEIRLEVESVDGRVSALSVTLDGVTITDESGQTLIKGSSIQTGSITADKIDATNLKVNAANITGTLTIGQIPSDVATEDQIPIYTSELINNSGYQTEYQVTTITNNAISTASISANQITTGTLNASYLSLNGLLSLLYYGSVYGYVGASTAGQYAGAVLTDATATNYFIATTGGARMSAGNTYEIYVYSGGCVSTHTINVLSDKRLKNNISYNMEDEEALFELLKPCSFQMNNDEEGKKRWGFVAQDVIESVGAVGMDANKLAVIGQHEDTYSIGYGEFTALNTHMIQKLMARVAELEEKVNGIS